MFLPSLTADTAQNNYAPTLTTTETHEDTKIAETKTTSRIERPSPEGVMEYVRKVSSLYGLDYEAFYSTIQGESSFSPQIVGVGGLSIGIGQFTLPTWLNYCSDHDDRTDWKKSLDCMGKMWSQGLEYRWDVYCNLYYDVKCIEKRGLYPGFLR